MRLLAYVALLLGVPVASMANSFESTCGAATFQVIAENRGHPLDNKYALYSAPSKDGERKLLYTSDLGGWFYAECVAGADNRKLLLFQAFCGGSTCVENKYGIVDPVDLKLLVIPPSENKGNSKAAQAVLKTKRVPYLPRSKTAFCCDDKPR
jgi:hypothetical protein